jgi:hypothetical protein
MRSGWNITDTCTAYTDAEKHAQITRKKDSLLRRNSFKGFQILLLETVEWGGGEKAAVSVW